MAVVKDYECFIMQMLYVCVLCASGGSSQCCILYYLQIVNAGRGCRDDYMEEAYSRAGLMTALTMSVSFCSPYPVAVSAFIICSGLCIRKLGSLCVCYM